MASYRFRSNFGIGTTVIASGEAIFLAISIAVANFWAIFQHRQFSFVKANHLDSFHPLKSSFCNHPQPQARQRLPSAMSPQPVVISLLSSHFVANGRHNIVGSHMAAISPLFSDRHCRPVWPCLPPPACILVHKLMLESANPYPCLPSQPNPIV